ncbi:hypothetical protein ACQCU1_16350 [Sutcliffiella horikoshii]|uniref:Uncharacterized protein n=1 Tax=Sutcliffiella horikoshii TaxID=79883 RepID=A0AA94WNL9_9BACI|nr:hypothetical protein [Sutcliffiella horikoshii]TYS58548.1 hypothetical protein FZC74_12140 [Sutcliffiella horikoshii]
MRYKSNTKRAGAPVDFWKNYRAHLKVPQELKAWILDQYYDKETLCVYCDASLKEDYTVMGIACSYVVNGTITIKQQYTQSSYKEELSSWYAEIKAIIFALTFFERHKAGAAKVIIFTDLIDIERILGEEPFFRKNVHLNEVREELKKVYQLKKSIYGDNLQVLYLPPDKRKFNPFHRSAHNAARKMIR